MCKVVITSRTVSGTVRHRCGRDAGLTWRHRRKLLRAAAIQTQLFFQYKVWMFLLHPSFSSCLSDKLLNCIELPSLERLARNLPSFHITGCWCGVASSAGSFLRAAAAHKVNYRLPGERSLTRNFHMDGIRGAQPINRSQVLV